MRSRKVKWENKERYISTSIKFLSIEIAKALP